MKEKEIEVKILGINIAHLEEKLNTLGAKLISIEDQTNINIDSSNHPISNTTEGYLRIRESKNLLDGKISKVITFKEQSILNGVRNSMEYTSGIDDVETIVEIFKFLGYNNINKGTKKRRSYIYKENRFDFDTWDSATYPYPYVEVEAKSSDKLHEILLELDIKKENISTKSIAELINSLNK